MSNSESSESDSTASGATETNPVDTAAPLDTAATDSSLAKVRRLVLFGVLFVMLGALVYDYAVARPAVNKAYKLIDEENIRINRIGGEVLTNEDVSELLGKKPISTSSDGTEMIEVYGWPSGIPGRPHKLYTVYKSSGRDKIFYRQSKFVYETSKEVAPIASTTVSPSSPTEEEVGAWEEMNRESEFRLQEMENRLAGRPPSDDDTAPSDNLETSDDAGQESGPDSESETTESTEEPAAENADDDSNDEGTANE